ncbi:MAG: signal peptidase I [Alphaproteobacteria bacterium]|nr:signal peptidase I [Alphaproteobacteria bacterium]
MADKKKTDPTAPSTLDTGKETLRTILSALIIAMVIRTFAFEPFNIPSSSMVPTLLVGDYLFVSKFAYGYGAVGTFWGFLPFTERVGGHEPQRGDVIVFKQTANPSVDFIKRLIGLPGDTIQMRQGILYINGVPVDRDRLADPVPQPDGKAPENATDYLEHLPEGPTHIIRKLGDDNPLDNTPVFTVPPHHYFFMGDNRDNSSDSRAPNGGVGYVPEANLVGKAEFLFFSIDEHTHFWEFWTWPWTVRWNRLFTGIH